MGSSSPAHVLVPPDFLLEPGSHRPGRYYNAGFRTRRRTAPRAAPKKHGKDRAGPRFRRRVSSRARWRGRSLRGFHGCGRFELWFPRRSLAFLSFLFGLIIGSFLNVCIVRIPAHKSIVKPVSACTTCGAPIRPYDNIPVVSYLLLGGKCRGCKARISAIYPLVELLTALLIYACYRMFGLTAEGAEMGCLLGVDDRARVHGPA